MSFNRTAGSGSKTTSGDNSEGGTGSINLPLIVNGIAYASNGNTLASTSPGTTGQVLTSNGPSSAPTFQTVTTIPLTANANTVFAGPTSGGPATPWTLVDTLQGLEYAPFEVGPSI